MHIVPSRVSEYIKFTRHARIRNVTLLIAFAILSHMDCAQAATYTVNATADGADFNIGDGICDVDPGAATVCTLRAAINEANADTAPDQIMIPAGIFTLDIPRAGTGSANDGDGESGDLDIDRDVVIVGAGPGQSIISGAGLTGASTDRIFHFRGSGTDVSLSGVTLEGGRWGGTGGAAIHNTAGGTVELDNIIVRDISAGASGPITNQGSGAGSAINIMRISNSAILTSYGSNTGAILQDYSGTIPRLLELTNVTIASTSHGSFPNNRNGAIRIDKGEASLSHVTLFNNRYGLDVESAVVTVSNSLFVDNGDDATGRNCRTDIQPVDADGLPSGGVITGGTITSLGGNFSSDGTCGFFSLPSDTNTGGNPGLADMIGVSGSVVVPFFTGSEILSNAACEATDQVGTARTATCVIGAYETTTPPPQVVASPGTTPGTVSGVVFRDYNDDGLRQVGEPAVSGIRVSAFTNSTTAIDTALTNANGQYSLNTGAGPVRLEFMNIPDWLEPGAVGADSDSTIQFVGAPASDINLSLFNPGQYCQTNPQMATTCFLFGDQTTYLSEDTVVGFSYEYGSGSRSDGSVIGENGFGGSGNPTGPWAYTDPTPDHLATGIEVGSTWGVAYQRTTGDLFVAAFHKRHSGQGPDGPGAIYRIDPTGAAPASTLITLPDAVADPHATNGGNWDLDADAWDTVGRVSLGDMDISDDDTTLFVANLEARTLDSIDIASATRTNQTPIPDTLPGAEVGCVATDVMPFAVAHHDGVSYLGLVCSATSTQDANDLRAYVYAYDGAAFGTAPVLEFGLGYPRGESYGGDSYSLPATWHPWTPQAATYTGQIPVNYFDQEAIAGDDDVIRASYPQPMLADIEFDNDDMVLSFMDRTGHQQANLQQLPDGSGFNDSDPAQVISLVDNVEPAGDILRACGNVASGWVIESNGTCGSNSTAGSNNREGVDGGEYYFEDAFLTAHPEVVMGGLEQIPGQSNVTYVAYDPVLWNRDFNSGGIHWASNEYGTWQRGYRLYDTRTGQNTFAKANGLGDIEALCFAAPIEIGNYVWIDTDKDGLQDPDETPVGGVVIGLYDAAGNLIALAETNASGQYLFSSDARRTDINADADTTPEFDYGIGALLPNQTYTVAILDSNFDSGGVLDGWSTTVSDSTHNFRDSDAVTVTAGGGANLASNGITLRTGAAGANNHSYDFGFVPPDYDLALIKTLKLGQSAWVLDGDTVNYEVEIRNQGDVASDVFSVVDVIPYGMSFGSASGTDFSCTLNTGSPPAVADEVLCIYNPPNAAALAPGASAIIDLTLFVNDLTQAPFQNWAEIENDSAARYGVTDNDSMPGDHNAADNGPGTGSNGSDPSIDHNDITHNGDDGYDDPTEDEDDSDPALVRAASTTPITLSSFQAIRNDAGRLVIRFSTSTEEANLGFHLYAQHKGGWRRLNESLIPTVAQDGSGARYSRSYSTTVATEFAISDVDTVGSETMHGPFALNQPYGREQTRRVKRSFQAVEDLSTATAAEQSSSNQGIYVDVSTPGIQIVTATHLAEAGLNWEGIDSNSIAVTYRGKAVARFIRGGVHFNENSLIEFLAPELSDNLYSARTRYDISINPELVQSVANMRADRRHTRALSSVGRATKTLEKDSFYSRLTPGDDPWYMKKLLSLGNTVTAEYNIHLDGLAPTGATQLLVDVWGGNARNQAGNDHHIIVAVNGVRIGARGFKGIREYRVELGVPRRILKTGNNTVTISVKSPGRAQADLIYLDSITFRYPRTLNDVQSYDFQLDGTDKRVRLQRTRDAVVYQRTNGETRRYRTTHRSSIGSSIIDLISNGAPARVYVSSTRLAARPELRRIPSGGDLFSPVADYLVITHSKFRSNDLKRLVSAREADGYRVKVVNVGWIYREYSGGERDARAIARYIKHAARRMSTRYVLLVGDDSYDYKNNLSHGLTSYIPSLYKATDARMHHIPVDPGYGDIDNDGIPDIAVGRLPVRSRTQLRHVVDKTLQYRYLDGQPSALMTADRRDRASLHSFKNDSLRMARPLRQRNWNVTAIDMEFLNANAIRSRVIRAMNTGTRLISYIGHSDRQRWGFDSLFDSDYFSTVDNAATPNVITQFGCWTNDYTGYGKASLAETLLVNHSTGAAAVIGSTTLSRTRTQSRLGTLFFDSISQPGMSLGAAMLDAKTKLARERSNTDLRDLLLGTILLGDPAIIPYPDTSR